MFELYIVTNRKLCKEDFLVRLEKLAAEKPSGIILREKDLSAQEYEKLAKSALEICAKHNVRCILHGFAEIARRLEAPALHVPLPLLRGLSEKERRGFLTLGASCHSLEEALEAERLGCTYVTAGHIFETECKKGLPGRGIEFLREICGEVSLPVYAIGGIGAENIGEVKKSGAKGACVMSGAFVCNDPGEYMMNLRERCREI